MASKRTVSMGSIEKIGDRKWRIRVRLGYDPIGKKYLRSPSRTVHGSKADAREALRRYREEVLFAIEHPELATLFKDYANTNYDNRAAEGGSPLARIRERSETNKCIDYYGKMTLGEITPLAIKQVNAQIVAEESMSESALYRMNRRLKAILKAAVLDGLIEKNPAEAVKVRKPEPNSPAALTLDEARRLSRCVSEPELDSLKVGIRLMLFTGIRKGEMLGLNWDEVDLKRSRIHIIQSFSNDKKLRPPKSKNSKRWIYLDEGTAQILQQWKDKQPETIPDFARFKQTGKTPVVTTPHGKRYDPTNYSKEFRDFCVTHEFGSYREVKTYVDKTGRKRQHAIGYEGLTPHALRHTQATLLIGNSTIDLKTVSGRLGHATVSTTTDTYADFIDGNGRIAANVIGELLD